MSDDRQITKHHLTVGCLNPTCLKPITFEVVNARGPKEMKWADIPDKVTLRCPHCGVIGDYHPKLTRGGKALPRH